MFKSTFYINFITSIILIVILSACIARNYKHEAIVEEWIGKELIVPEELVFQIQDTQIQCNFNNADFKIVTYIDSAGCTSCRMKLREWESFINDLNTLTDVDVNFLMVVNKIEKDEVCRILRMNSFKLPVSIDSCGIFKTANTIPKEFAHSTFLIDSQNRIVAIGNPIDNPKIRELYARILITANNELSLESQSILDIDRYKDICENNVIAFGTANTGDTIKRIFRLENKSHDRLTIQDLIPSCNCVSASVCKNIIEKGGYSDIEMAYIADSLAGSRKMQVKIFFEEEERPYIISMHGFVIKKIKNRELTKMNKKFISAAFAAMVGIVICSGFNVFKSNESVSSLKLANVEALADEESGKSVTCYNTITSQDGSQVRYCPTCSWLPGTDSWCSGKSTCTVN